MASDDIPYIAIKALDTQKHKHYIFREIIYKTKESYCRSIF